MFQVGASAVKAVSQDVAVDGGRRVLPALPPGQQLPQPGGGDVHQPRQGDGGDFRPGVGLLQVFPLGGEKLLPVLFGASKGAHPRQLQNPLRLAPEVEGEEHVRPHEKPQLRPWVLLFQLSQGVGGVALPRPVQLHGGCLRHLGHQQDVGHFGRHGQPVLRPGRALRQLLVGRNGVRNDEQLVQAQHIHRRTGRRQMPQMGRIEGSAINTDFHH